MNNSRNNSASERRIRIDIPPHGYEVIIGTNLLARLGELLNQAGVGYGAGRAFIVHDEALPAAMIELARQSLHASGLQVTSAAVQADETHKTMDGVHRLLVQIARTRHERDEPLIALGGGIVGDVAGFAAAIYRRGIPVVQCPTTLLAMVDAAVGGKTAVNLEVDSRVMKNLVGSFHQPALVLADVLSLQSLSDRQMRCGLAECIKHGMIGAEFGEPGLLDWIERSAPAILAKEPALLVELVARNVAIKAAVVADDEREERNDGGRALLNLGHTFGHAYETIEGATPETSSSPGVHHGEAVALGLISAAACAEAAGICPRELHLRNRITQVVRACRLPVTIAGLPPTDEILARMAHDKKVKRGSLRLVLPTAFGACGFFENPKASAVVAGIDAIRA